MSSDTIYTAIYDHARGELRQELIDYLRNGRSTRLPSSRELDGYRQIFLSRNYLRKAFEGGCLPY